MKLLQLSITGLIILFISLSGCTEKTTENENDDPVDPDSLITLNTLELNGLGDCANLNTHEFCSRGFSFLQLGDSLTYKSFEVEGATVKDTVYEAFDGMDTIAWNVKLVRFEEGQIIMESDFSSFFFFGRARIETEAVKTKHGIGVGSTFKELKETYNGLLAAEYTEEKLVEVYIEDNPFIIFHLEDPEGKYSNEEDPYDLSKIPEDTKIVRVILWDKMAGMDM